MLRNIAILLAICLFLVACSKSEEKIEGSNQSSVISDLKNTSSNTLAVGSGSVLPEGEGIVFTSANLTRYFTAMKKLNQQYPDIDFSIPAAAAVAIGKQVQNFPELIERETEMSFDEYSRLSMAIIKVKAGKNMEDLTKRILSQLRETEKKIAEVTLPNAPETEKKKLSELLDSTQKRIRELDAKLKSDEFRKYSNELELVERVKEQVGL